MTSSLVLSGLILASTLSLSNFDDKVPKLVKFTRPEILQCFSPTLLAELLGRYPALLEARGARLPAVPDENSMPYHRIAELFLCGGDLMEQGAPLYEAIHLVNRLASAAGRELLLQLAEQQNIIIPSEAMAANHDLALWMWLHHPRLLESAGFRVGAKGNQSYFHYRLGGGLVAPLNCSPDTVQQFQHVLRSHYESISKGSFVRILSAQQDDELWLLIRHGGHMEHHASINDETDSVDSICYRGEECDLLVYNQIHGDLKIRHTNDKTLDVLRSGFGRFFFGNADYFTGEGIFVLDRFKQPGCPFMASTIVPGIASVVLEEVCYTLPGGCDRAIHEKSPKLLCCLRECSSMVPPNALWVDSAHLGFKFVGARQYSPVKLSVPNMSTHVRESDAWLVEQWLRKAGLMKGAASAEDAAVA